MSRPAGIPVAIKREFADEVLALALLVGEGSVAVPYDPKWWHSWV